MTQNEHVYAICCRPEVAGDVISSENVKTIEGYAVLNFEVASSYSFRDIKKNISWLSENALRVSLKKVNDNCVTRLPSSDSMWKF